MGFDVSDQQAKETAIYMLEDCRSFNLSEMTLLFKQIKKGKYGQFYGRFNGQIILQAVKEYRKDRGLILLKMSSSEIQKYQ